MKKSSKITVAFPTFNRKEAIQGRVKEYLAEGLESGIKLLVIDNDSPDGTYESLRLLVGENTNITLKKNSQNLGFVGNFFQIFKECDTDYVLISSDEDKILFDKIPQIERFLYESDYSFVRPLVRKDGRAYCGKEASVGNLNASDFRKSAFYVSGLIFRVESGLQYISKLDYRTSLNSAVHDYPQITMAALAIAEDRACWFPVELTKMVDQLPTEIIGANGGKYTTLQSRFEQTKGYVELFSDLQRDPDFAKYYDRLEIMKDQARLDLFALIRHSLRIEGGEFLSAFDQAGREFHLGNRGFLRRGKRLAARIVKKFR